MAEIGLRSSYLGDRLRRGLADTPGVTTHDLGRQQCAIVTARVSGTDSADVADALAAHGINVSTTVPAHNQFDIRKVHPLVRLSPHYYNTDDEIDQAIGAVAALAR
jgi:selenocysteine lyase/cysteine desulfurase